MFSNHTDPFPVPDYTSRFSPSYWDEVGDWFRVVGGAYLRSLTELPDALDLADWLMEAARRYEPRGKYPGTGWMNVKGMGRYDIVDRAEETAEWLLENHKPKRRSRFTREQAVKGGKSQRRPKYLLRRYARLMAELEATGEVLTLAEVAERLGCARQSVYRLREQLKTIYVDLAPVSSLDELMADIDPEPEVTSEIEIPAPVETEAEPVEEIPTHVPAAWTFAHFAAMAEQERRDAEVDAVVGPLEPAQPVSEAEEDDLLAALDDSDNTIPETSASEPVEEIPTHVPASWTVDHLQAVAEQMRRDAEANVSFDIFADIEVSA